jgi:hypothetical protein
LLNTTWPTASSRRLMILSLMASSAPNGAAGPFR